MELSFEQVINDHLELKKRNAALNPGQEVDEEDEMRTREDVTGEEPGEGGALWTTPRDFEWGE